MNEWWPQLVRQILVQIRRQEAGGVSMKQNRKLTWDTLHSNMYSDFQEVIFKITNFALSITSLWQINTLLC